MHAVHSPWRGVEFSSLSSPHVNMSISNHSTTSKSWRSDAPIILPGWECHTGGSRSKPTVHRCRPKTGGCGLLTRTQDEPTKKKTHTHAEQNSQTPDTKSRTRQTQNPHTQTHAHQTLNFPPPPTGLVYLIGEGRGICGVHTEVQRFKLAAGLGVAWTRGWRHLQGWRR